MCIKYFLDEAMINIQENMDISCWATLRKESSQTNVILQYKLLAAILSAVCSVI